MERGAGEQHERHTPGLPWIGLLTSLVVLVAAYALKRHFSEADPDQLTWILAPTVVSVELVTGLAFDVEPGVGYVARSEPFAVTKSCAGVNFLIVSFAMLALVGAWRAGSVMSALRTILVAAIVAFLATIVANTLRIATAMPFAHAGAPTLGLSGEGAHRVIGVGVYFLSLLFLYAVFVLRRYDATAGKGARAILWLVPLGFYLAVTLGVPLLNGWVRGRPMAWSEHTLVLLLLPAALLVLVFLVTRAMRAAASRLRRSG